MNTDLEQIKADLTDSKNLVTKVAADVALLHSKIDALGDAPTAEQIAEVKALSADLKASLTAVDEQTAEETV